MRYSWLWAICILLKESPYFKGKDFSIPANNLRNNNLIALVFTLGQKVGGQNGRVPNNTGMVLVKTRGRGSYPAFLIRDYAIVFGIWVY